MIFSSAHNSASTPAPGWGWPLVAFQSSTSVLISDDFGISLELAASPDFRKFISVAVLTLHQHQTLLLFDVLFQQTFRCTFSANTTILYLINWFIFQYVNMLNPCRAQSRTTLHCWLMFVGCTCRLLRFRVKFEALAAMYIIIRHVLTFQNEFMFQIFAGLLRYSCTFCWSSMDETTCSDQSPFYKVSFRNFMRHFRSFRWDEATALDSRMWSRILLQKDRSSRWLEFNFEPMT